MTTAAIVRVDGTHVWHASTDAAWIDRDRVERACAWLTPQDRARYDRFRFDADRQLFLLGRTMSRALVGRALGVPPTAWEWREGPHGRPEIAAPATTLHFNIAHSAGLVVCALSHTHTVGVDVEDLLRGSQTDPALVARYCTPREAAVVAAPTEGWRARFLEFWTLKEAYLKARGLGIALPLAELGFTLGADGIHPEFLGSLADSDTNWTFHLERVTERHLLAVAVPESRHPAPIVAPFPASLLP